MIGHKIARMREILGVTQQDLASRLDVKQQMVSKLEKKESIDTAYLAKIAHALGVSPEAITEFNEASLVTNINQQGGIVNGININPLETIIKLYEEKLEAKDKEIERLQKKLNKID